VRPWAKVARASAGALSSVPLTGPRTSVRRRPSAASASLATCCGSAAPGGVPPRQPDRSAKRVLVDLSDLAPTGLSGATYERLCRTGDPVIYSLWPTNAMMLRQDGRLARDLTDPHGPGMRQSASWYRWHPCTENRLSAVA
jgi:hypothetical protein